MMAFQKFILTLGLLCGLSGPIFLFGRHARPEIGFPLFLGGLALMFAVTFF